MAMLTWKPPLFAKDEKRNKSFWLALQAVKKFYALRSTLLEDYELVYYNGKPSCELSACVILPDGFRYRLYIDAVLRNIKTSEVMVLECKTTGSRSLNPAMYKNSNQGVGYAIIIDSLFPGLGSYQVLYLPYSTATETFTPFPFFKTNLDRALWLNDLITDIRVIQIYEENSVYPRRGGSCFNYNRECEFFNTCDMSNSYLVKPCSEEHEDKTTYDIYIDFETLVAAQLGDSE